jgi:hypothetical protein
MDGDIEIPLERVLEVLHGIRERIDNEFQMVLDELTWVMKVISGNKLYDVSINAAEQTKEVTALVGTFSKAQRKNTEDFQEKS